MTRLLAFLFALLAGTAALAHKPSDSYLSLEVRDAVVAGQWDIALRDLEFAIGLDADGNGEITWGELKARHAEIASYALARLAVTGDGAACPLKPAEQLADNHSDGAYAVLRFTATCPQPPRALGVSYRLFFDLDPQHKGLLRLAYTGQTRTAIFTPEARQQSFALEAPSLLAQFADYLVEGIWHIWMGYDHILFLISLLLPAVVLRRQQRWLPVGTFREAFIDVLKVVTAFTVAHSITLSLATLGVVRLPARISEAAIAASVVVAALNNIFPVIGARRWMVAFCFGLIHGFGFANVLADLGLPQGTLALALVGFNLGVEVGQLAIVTGFLPLAYALRQSWFYRRLVLLGGSAAIAGLAGMWFVGRAFDVKFLPAYLGN